MIILRLMKRKAMLCKMELRSIGKIMEELVQTFEDENLPNKLKLSVPEVLMRHLKVQSEK
jgi:hypothetical protein